MKRNTWLIVGGGLSSAAAVLHWAAIPVGASWYRFFGAGEAMARAAERGSAVPGLWAGAIGAILAVWAAYAFSGAGLIPRLPLLRTALVLISAVYLLRALFLPVGLQAGPQSDAFWWWSSLIVLGYGVAYAVGTWRAWPELRRR